MTNDSRSVAFSVGPDVVNDSRSFHCLPRMHPPNKLLNRFIVKLMKIKTE